MLMNKRRNYRLLFVLAAAGIGSFFSCNRTFPDAANQLKTDYPDNYSGNATAAKRVLYLILDGAQGSEIKTLAPANITKLTKSAIYAYIGISGYNPGDTALPGAWTSMMTGVSSAKSKVFTGFDSADLQTFPSFVTRLSEQSPAIKVDAYAASSDFSTHLLSGAAQNVLTQGDDSLVAQNVKNALSTDSASVVVGQFHSIAAAGDTYGYLASVQQYASAVNKVDGYIGDIMNALKSRANYANENWLVIIASNENGKINQNAGGDSTSAFDDTRRNSFIVFNNARFQTDFVGSNGKPSTLGLSAYNDSALLFTGIGSTGVNVTIPSNNAYNIVPGNGATIELKFKLLSSAINDNGGNYFLNLAANGGGFTGGPNGWSVWVAGNNFKFYFGDASSVPINIQPSNNIADGQWHTFCATVYWPAGGIQVSATVYIDGVMAQSQTANFSGSGGTLSPGRPITVGARSDQGSVAKYADFLLTDFRYWNTQLPYNIIAQYYCKNEILPGSPYYSNLVADFRMNDGSGSTSVTDNSPTHNNGTINDPSDIESWNHFDELSNVVCPNPDVNFYKAAPNGLDIPMQIYQWLGVLPQPIWGLDGQYWNSGYTDVQLPANE